MFKIPNTLQSIYVPKFWLLFVLVKSELASLLLYQQFLLNNYCVVDRPINISDTLLIGTTQPFQYRVVPVLSLCCSCSHLCPALAYQYIYIYNICSVLHKHIHFNIYRIPHDINIIVLVYSRHSNIIYIFLTCLLFYIINKYFNIYRIFYKI